MAFQDVNLPRGLHLGPCPPPGTPSDPESKTSDNSFLTPPPTHTPASCEHPYFFPSSPLGEGEFLGSTFVQGPSLLGFAELPREAHLMLHWRASRLTILPSSLTSTQRTHMVIFPTKCLPKTAASLGGEGGGEGPGSPACRLTFSLLLGDHWRRLREGLAYLTIGSRVGGCWKAKEKRQESKTPRQQDDSHTERHRVRGKKEETFQC